MTQKKEAEIQEKVKELEVLRKDYKDIRQQLVKIVR